jgi:capsular polysaccharide biosynthesis protein
MDFWDLGRLMVRRWYVSLPLLLLTFAATVFTAVAVKPDYVLTSYIQLIPPTEPTNDTQGTRVQNPWLSLGLDSLNQAATVAAQDQTFLDRLTTQGNNATIEITDGDNNPVATIAVVAPTLAQAEDATAQVIDRYNSSASTLQNQYGVQKRDMITSQRLDNGENVKRPGGKVKRSIVVVFGIGVLLTGGLTILVDALWRRRRRPANVSASEKVLSGQSAKPLDATNNTESAAAKVATRQPAQNDVNTTLMLTRLGVFAADTPPRRTANGPDVAARGAAEGESDRDSSKTADTTIIPALANDATIVFPRAGAVRDDDDPAGLA